MTINRFCRSYDVCQHATKKNAQKHVPLIDVPFNHVAINLIGPIIPTCICEHSYILMVVDFVMQYPETPIQTL